MTVKVALVVELVDTQDLKSCDHCGRAGSTPARGTKNRKRKGKEKENTPLFLIFTLSLSVSLSPLALRSVSSRYALPNTQYRLPNTFLYQISWSLDGGSGFGRACFPTCGDTGRGNGTLISCLGVFVAKLSG
jgi:hypothetical protein